MRLFCLEVKRVLRTRMTKILMLLVLAATVFFAVLPLSFPYGTVWEEDGSTRILRGLEGIRYIKELQKDVAGTVTSEKVKQAAYDYQSVLDEYEAGTTYELLDELYEKRIRPLTPLTNLLREAYTDLETGIVPSIWEMDLESVGDVYKVLDDRLSTMMELQQEGHPEAQEQAEVLYGQVEKPFVFYPGGDGNLMDYEILVAFLILIFCVAMAAPVFSSDYQTGADDILRCTKHGRLRLGFVKVLSALAISAGATILCLVVYLLTSNGLVGWEWTKSSMQMFYSALSLPNLTIGELQWCIAASGLLTILATVGTVLFVSSRCSNAMVTTVVGVFLCILPVIANIFIPGDAGLWLGTILPTGGVSLQGSMLYALSDFQFLHLGNYSVWTPYAILTFAALEFVGFSAAAVFSYARYRRA